MTIYMVFEPPPARAAETARAERIVFVPDRFTWSAFLLAPVWMLWHRLWLVLGGYVLVTAAITAALRFAGAASDGRMLVGALVMLLVGLEAPSLRRWTLLRNGWREVGTVVGDNRESAERRFFDRYVVLETTHEMETALAASQPPPLARHAAPDVVGLFPQPGGNA
jgi:hypothetical protein